MDLTFADIEEAFAMLITRDTRAEARASVARMRLAISMRVPRPPKKVQEERVRVRKWHRKRAAEIKPRNTVDYNRKGYVEP